MLSKKNDGSFDLCIDSGAPAAFFPGTRGAMLGTYKEVSCSEWHGSDGATLWNGWCMAGEKAGFWPKVGCSNIGAIHPLRCTMIPLWLMHILGTPPA